MSLSKALVPIAAAATAVGLLLLAARGGPGVSSDSVAYLDGARALANGFGYVAETGAQRLPITHYPPLYSLALAAIGTASADQLSRALYLNVALRVALLFMVWLGLRRIAHLGQVPTGIALGLLAVSPDLTDVHAMVWSEPLFFVESVGAFFLLARNVHDGRRHWLIAASFLLAAAVLTRYAGLGLLAAPPLLLVAWRERSWRARLADISVYVACAAIPVAGWFLRNRGVAPAFEDWLGESRRSLALHLPTLQDWGTGASTLSLWLFPYVLPAVVGALVVLGSASLALTLVVRRARSFNAKSSSLEGLLCARVFLIAGFSYLVFVVVARSVADAAVPFDSRLLSPAYVYLVVGATAASGSLDQIGLRVRRVGAVLAGLLMTLLLRHGYIAAMQGEANPGYAGRRYIRMAQEVARVQRTVAYTNDPFFLRFFFSSAVPSLPFRSNPYSNAPNPGFASEVAALCRALAPTGRTVLYTIPPQERNPTLGELMGLGRLQIEARGADWVLLGPGACS